MNKILFLIFCCFISSCTLLRKSATPEVDCKKESIKELKRLKKYLGEPSEGGVYTYKYADVEVPNSFETIFWERKIGRDYAVTVQLYDTTAMQFLQLALSLQNIIYSDCELPVLKEDLETNFGFPSYVSKSMLSHAKETYKYSFNHPYEKDCYHGNFMGEVAYQECLYIDIEINNRGQVVELNTTSFDISDE